MLDWSSSDRVFSPTPTTGSTRSFADKYKNALSKWWMAIRFWEKKLIQRCLCQWRHHYAMSTTERLGYPVAKLRQHERHETNDNVSTNYCFVPTETKGSRTTRRMMQLQWLKMFLVKWRNYTLMSILTQHDGHQSVTTSTIPEKVRCNLHRTADVHPNVERNPKMIVAVFKWIALTLPVAYEIRHSSLGLLKSNFSRQFLLDRVSLNLEKISFHKHVNKVVDRLIMIATFRHWESRAKSFSLQYARRQLAKTTVPMKRPKTIRVQNLRATSTRKRHLFSLLMAWNRVTLVNRKTRIPFLTWRRNVRKTKQWERKNRVALIRWARTLKRRCFERWKKKWHSDFLNNIALLHWSTSVLRRFLSLWHIFVVQQNLTFRLVDKPENVQTVHNVK